MRQYVIFNDNHIHNKLLLFILFMTFLNFHIFINIENIR